MDILNAEMDWSFIISISSVVVSVIAMLFSIYYASRSKKYAKQSLSLSERQLLLSEDQQLHQYISEASEHFKKRGSPAIHYIDTIPGLTSENKERVYYYSYFRIKGKPPEDTFEEAIKRKEDSTKNKQPWIAKSGDTFQCRTECIHRDRRWIEGETLEAFEDEIVPYHFDLIKGDAHKKPLKSTKRRVISKGIGDKRGWVNRWRL